MSWRRTSLFILLALALGIGVGRWLWRAAPAGAPYAGGARSEAEQAVALSTAQQRLEAARQQGRIALTDLHELRNSLAVLAGPEMLRLTAELTQDINAGRLKLLAPTPDPASQGSSP
jgi:hypothetical protein